MSFSSLNVGLSALLAHRQAAETISHNIANANTEGYSRQRTELQAAGAAAVPALYARNRPGGTGVRVDATIRIRNEFLETQYRNEAAQGQKLGIRQGVLDRVENTFPEPGPNGLDEALGQFWGSWVSVVNNPESQPARSSVLAQAQTVADRLHLTDGALRQQRGDTVTQAKLMATEINDLAGRVATFDQAIRSAVVAGESPNDLMDQRDAAVVSLAKLTGATVEAGEHGTVDVFVGGRALIHAGQVEQLQVQEVDDPAFADVGLKKVQVTWGRDGYPANLTTGELAGAVAGANTDIPTYIRAVDEVARQLVTSVNALHQQGKDLDGNPGGDFFDSSFTTAGNIALSANVQGQPNHVVAASATGGPLDTGIAEQLSKLANAPVGASASYHGLIVNLGLDVRQVSEAASVQDSVVERLDEDRRSASGVNLDEEMVNLVSEQKAYAAAARVITTVDEMLDILINRTGTVGR
jgi:flagellar hook-associated protein 1 FlgK